MHASEAIITVAERVSASVSSDSPIQVAARAVDMRWSSQVTATHRAHISAMNARGFRLPTMPWMGPPWKISPFTQYAVSAMVEDPSMYRGARRCPSTAATNTSRASDNPIVHCRACMRRSDIWRSGKATATMTPTSVVPSMARPAARVSHLYWDHTMLTQVTRAKAATPTGIRRRVSLRPAARNRTTKVGSVSATATP